MPLSRRDFTRLAAMGALTTATGGATLLGTSSAALAADTAYVFGYFKETPDQSGDSYALHLAVSTDGLNWRPLNQNNPVATPTAGTLGLRDPFILRKQDGTFVVLATDLRGRIFTENNQYLHVWDSTDLRSFTGYRRIRMHALNTHTWAPTAFWVPSRNQYAIVYSAHNGQDVFMVNYTSDFRTVSANQVYFSPGYPVLDADIVADGSTFYMYYKNMSDGLLHGARSSSDNPNTFSNYTGGLRQGGAIEAPLLIKNNSGSGWRLWGDSFSPVNNDYYAWSSSNIGGNSWTVLGQRDFTPPLNAKHGSIVGITGAEYDRPDRLGGGRRHDRGRAGGQAVLADLVLHEPL
ncbi:glycoside hydrolase family 43 protein, partial [Actinoplanes philippinensis]|uniref:glycoside hydrolase family 43 protein n=1 Tax=Actinoplanes philippinensis TaxID=35752 RepID=UPI0033DC0722